MPEKTARKLKRAPVIEVPAPILQVMPQHRCRVDPSVLPDLMHFVYAVRHRWDRASRETGRGTKGHARILWRGRVRHARLMIEAIDALANALYESVDLRLIDESRRLWEEALNAMAEAV